VSPSRTSSATASGRETISAMHDLRQSVTGRIRAVRRAPPTGIRLAPQRDPDHNA
jgi:hypothetical protein